MAISLEHPRDMPAGRLEGIKATLVMLEEVLMREYGVYVLGVLSVQPITERPRTLDNSR